MHEALTAMLEPMLTIFLFLAVGFGLRKSKILPENADVVLSRMASHVFLPAQVFVTFLTYCTWNSLVENGRYVLYAAICLAIGLVAAYLLGDLFSKQRQTRGVFRYGLVFANFGYLGNYLIPKILGEQYLYPYLLFTLPVTFLAFAWGMGQMIPAGESGTKLWKRLCNPVIFAMFAGGALGLLGVGRMSLGVVTDALQDLSACMGPTAMILTGFVVGGYPVRQLLSDRRVYRMTLLRLVVLPALLLPVVYLLGADLPVMVMVLVAFGAALGVNTVVFTAAYGGDTKPGAAMAMVSHVCAVISIPVLYSLLMQILKG